ncbi:MAG: hypothetical protein ACM67P_05845 [Clostridiales bacterium]
MARKNFLFGYSEKGAEAAGTLMTVIRTARLNQADPEKYIAYVLTQPWEDRPGRHRQPSSVVRNPSERGEVIETRGAEERRG